MTVFTRVSPDGIGRVPLLTHAACCAETAPQWIDERRDEINATLLQHGAILFRGLGITDALAFQSLVRSLGDSAIDYTYRSTPRTKILKDVFSATEYHPRLEIPLHNENAYQRSWPMRVAFCCIRPSAMGGQTPLADMRAVTRALPPALLESLEQRRVSYIRHYHPGIDLTWEEAFQCDSQAEVARFCQANEIEYEWLDGLLRTTHISQGTSVHPQTRERLFFNQAHLFHISSLGKESAKTMIEAFGRDRLPRHARYADGGEFPEEALEAVRQALQQESIMFEWQPGDVLLLDNMQFAHGRKPFSGRREHLAALLSLHSHA